MARQLNGTEQKRIQREWNRATTSRACLVLERPMNPFNLGIMLRTAAALRFSRIYYGASGVSPEHAKVHKTSLRTERYLDFVPTADALEGIALAREDGYAILGLESAHGALPLHDIPLIGDVCLVVGNEDHGMSSGVIDACDHVGFIPLMGRVGSLNVAAASSIAMYEIRRSHWQMKGQQSLSP